MQSAEFGQSPSFANAVIALPRITAAFGPTCRSKAGTGMTEKSQTSPIKRSQKGVSDEQISVIAMDWLNEWDWIIYDGKFGLFGRTHT